MPIDENFSLDNPEGLTEEDIRKMNEEADKLEQIAQNAEKNAEKIEKAKKSMEGLNFAQLDLLNKTVGGETNLTSLGSINKEELMELIIDIMKTVEIQKKEIDEQRKKLTEEEKARKELEKKIRETESNIQRGYSDASGFLSSPTGFLKNKTLGLLGKAGIAGMVAQFAIQMGEQVYDEIWGRIKEAFGAGGIFDVRKLVSDEVKEYNAIGFLNRIKSGQVFMSADAGQYLRQGASRDAGNTRDLRDGHLRYINREIGY